MTPTPGDALSRSLDAAARTDRLALVPFVTGGFPTPSHSLALMEALADAGADALEVGIPFSDPLADGPTIQRSSQAALDAGVDAAAVLELIARFRRSHATPIVVMTYANPILAMGADRFTAEACRVGVNGLLVTDLPPEELPELWSAFRDSGLATIQLVAPTTAETRVPSLTSAASGFVYCVSRTGVTGKGHTFAQNLADQIGRIRRSTELPVLVGFGVREPEDVAAVAPMADGVVVGAAVLEAFMNEPDAATGIAGATALMARLRPALRKPAPA